MEPLDPLDWRILARMQQDARITNVELAKAVNLSPSACLNRVRRLEESGIISRHVTLLDPLKCGRGAMRCECSFGASDRGRWT